MNKVKKNANIFVDLLILKYSLYNIKAVKTNT